MDTTPTSYDSLQACMAQLESLLSAAHAPLTSSLTSSLHITPPPCIVVQGGPGAGKSHLLSTLADEWRGQHIPVASLSARDLVLAVAIDRNARPWAAALKTTPPDTARPSTQTVWNRLVLLDDADELAIDLQIVRRLRKRIFASIQSASSPSSPNTRTLFVLAGSADNTRWAKMVERTQGTLGSIVRISDPTMDERRHTLTSSLANLSHPTDPTDSTDSTNPTDSLVDSLLHESLSASGRDVSNALAMTSTLFPPSSSTTTPTPSLLEIFRYAMVTGKTVTAPTHTPTHTHTPTPFVGYPDILAQLHTIVSIRLANPELAAAYNVEGGAGILLYGVAGVGKSLLAMQMAQIFGNHKMRTFTVTINDVLSSYVGETEANIRALFAKVRDATPAVLFLDNIDAFAPRRNDQDTTGENVLTQLLTEMDGISARGEILLVGTSSRPDLIDAALLRPGRLDHLIHIPLPDPDSRKAILVQAGFDPASPDLPALIDLTHGFTGADLVALADTAEACVAAAITAIASHLATPSVSPEAAQDLAELTL